MISVDVNRARGPLGVREKNKERVKKWFLANPGMTVADCARELSLTWQTVKRHVVDIQKVE